MNVSELNKDQLEELRESYFYQLLEMDEDVLGEIDFPQKIPISNVLNHYEGVYFVEEDFSCSAIENIYIIEDWAGNRIFPDKEFETYDDGWAYIYENIDNSKSDQSGNEDEDEYQEYFVILKK